MNYFSRLAPPSPIARMIRFGDCFFSYPEPLAGPAGLLAPLDNPGLYVVLVHDPVWQPMPYRPLYFGESDRIWSRATNSQRTQRQAVESTLIARYNTSCNERLSFAREGLFGGRRKG